MFRPVARSKMHRRLRHDESEMASAPIDIDRALRQQMAVHLQCPDLIPRNSDTNRLTRRNLSCVLAHG